MSDGGERKKMGDTGTGRMREGGKNEGWMMGMTARGWSEARATEMEPGRRDVEREWGLGEGCVHCSFPGDCALPALHGRRHDNQYGCRCHSFIASSFMFHLVFFPPLSPPLLLSFTAFISHSLFFDSTCFLFFLLSLFFFILPSPPLSFPPIPLQETGDREQLSFTFTVVCVCVWVFVCVCILYVCVCAITGL